MGTEMAKIVAGPSGNEPEVENAKELELRPAVAGPEGKKAFLVSWAGDTAPQKVVANDANEAWALYCDSNKKWPSPKSRTIVAA